MRKWLRPRFGLRLLMLAVTAFAIGFPIWYRWPYEEVRELDDFSSRVTTWQRQWGGRRPRHGPERHFADGQLSFLMTYRDGLMHGPYFSYSIRTGANNKLVRDSEPAETGEYLDDEKHGAWTHVDSDGQKTVTHWHHGRQIDPKSAN